MKAIVLFSGGLDSTVLLAIALNRGCQCHALSFDYQQRHRVELDAACAIAQHYGIDHSVIVFDRTVFAKSSSFLVSDTPASGIPSTYVPARNTLFLAYAAGQAEMIGAEEIYLGSNTHDHAGYPDCRPLFVEAFQKVLNVATQQAVEGRPPQLVTPLLHMDKADIIRKGKELQAPLHLTLSCYAPPGAGLHCRQCDACRLRQEGFAATGIEDPTQYCDFLT